MSRLAHPVQSPFRIEPEPEPEPAPNALQMPRGNAGSAFGHLKPAVTVMIALACFTGACSGGDPAVARRNQVFYAYETIGGGARNEFETPYPPFDLAARDPSPGYVGVAVLSSHVRLSRPTNWVIRAASNEPGQRYLQYISPSEYVVSIFERAELPNAPWHDVVARYEKELTDSRAEIAEPAVPIATWNGQGRAYLVRRRVPAAKGPFVGVSREYLVRADHRIVLVQVVHPEGGLPALSGELLRVIETLELL